MVEQHNQNDMGVAQKKEPQTIAKQYLRCKACGFVIEEGKLGDLCPACGVKRAMFIPDTEKVSEKRRKILDSHIHPIIVHFPQAFTGFALALLLVAQIMTGQFKIKILDTAQILLYCLPFVVIASFISGWIDGKVRFRKVTTPMLKKKIALGILLFLCTKASAIIAAFFGYTLPGYQVVLLILLTIATVCTILLGRLGTGLLNARFQG